jgi:NAD-dependent SIR2 family protein deacetylase
MKQKQVWRCQGCGHEFYSPVEKKQAWYRRIFRRQEKIECNVCAEVKAIRVRVVSFKDKEKVNEYA